jgi:excisionase family DNA binding protein
MSNTLNIVETASANEKLLTVKELAKALNLSGTSWIYQKSRVGEIPMIRLGKHIRFDLDEVKKHFSRVAQ